MTTPLVTIPKHEYDELMLIKNEFDKAFEDKKIIMRYRSWSAGPGGPIREYTLVNETDVITNLNKELLETKSINGELQESNNKLQFVLKHKSWFQYIPKWYELLPFKGGYYTK